MCVRTSDLHFCSPHWIQKYLHLKKTVSLCKTPLSYITPMHTLPLFCSTPCMPSPCSVPPHACPSPILSHPMHALSLFDPTSCIPSPYSIPAHAYPAPYSIPAHAYLAPILSQPMLTLPIFYPSSCTPSPYSIPAYTHPPPILFYPIHVPPYSIPLYACPLLFSTSPHMSPQYSVPAQACPTNSLSHEPGRHVSPLTSENAAFESAHTEYIIIIYRA